MSNRPRVSNAATRHVQIVVFKKQWSGFLFLSNTTFCPKNVFPKKCLLVLLGNFFLPCLSSAPGWFVWWKGIAVNKQLCPSLHSVGRINLLPEQELCSQLLFSLSSPHSFLTPEHCVSKTLVILNMDSYEYDASHGCSVYNLHNGTVTVLGGEIYEFPNSIHSQEIRLP